MATEDKSIKRRRGTESALKSTGQLIDGQAGFCSDKKKILFKRPATWTSPGTIDEYDFDGLQTQINTEANARSDADITLQSNFDGLQTQITTEVGTRSENDSTLQSNIDAEALARASADSTLQSSTYKSVSTAAEFLTLAADYYSPHLWVAANIVVTLPASLYIRAPIQKIIDGPGTITLIGNADNTQCNIYCSTNPISNSVDYMAGASVDFKCNIAVTQFFTCHKSTFRFRRITSTTISSETLYGIFSDSDAKVRYCFSDNGYVLVSTGGDLETVIYDGCDGRMFYNTEIMFQEIATSISIYPKPNFTYKLTGSITVTFNVPRVESSMIAFNMEFYIRLAIGCGTILNMVLPDPDGNSVTYNITKTSSGTDYKTIKVKQMGSGYILDPM